MNFTYGICLQTMIPLRESPSHKSQMNNQLLFGDLFLIKDKLDDWLFIETIDDNYESWIHQTQVDYISKVEFENIKSEQRHYSLYDSITILNEEEEVEIRYTIGSLLPHFDNDRFSIKGKQYSHHEKFVHSPNKPSISNFGDEISRLAMRYLNAPYLWGGRSIFGIDCSGFTQIIFKMAGIFIPRDASQQINIGETLSFIDEAMAGDLAFFENEDGEIVHVGIMMNNHQIIHSSGKVRIDKIDHNGIYDAENKKYTHKLRLIKRIVL